MKNNKILLLTLLCPLLLTSCRSYFDLLPQEDSGPEIGPNNTYKVDVFNVIKATKNRMNIVSTPSYRDVYSKSIYVKFYDEEHLVPYLTLDDFLSIENSLLDSGKGNIVKTSTSLTYSVTYGGELYFSFIDDYDKGVFNIAGDLSSLAMSSNVASDSSLKLGYTYIRSDYYQEDENFYKEYSYKNAGFVVHEESGTRYYPLSLLSLAFNDLTYISFFYNYDDIYVTDDFEYFKEEFRYSRSYQTINPYADFYNIAYKTTNQMSDAVKQDRLSSYLFFLQNMYGLKSTWGWSDEDMDEFLDSFNFKEDMLSDNALTRQKALTNLSNNLDDAHTGVDASPWEKGQKYTGDRGPRIQHMIESGSNINAVRRKANLKAINYSTDGSTALFVLDEFMNITSNYRNKTASQLAKDDDFFYVAETLKTIKNKGGVKNVIIDITMNGGGYVSAMLKILALLSSNNNAEAAFYTETTDTYEIDGMMVDSNLDGKYDADDVYGDDFNFYIMPSYYSFSCGNAFPFLAQKYNYATIIGEESGGGECVVIPLLMPTGEEVSHSSHTHIGYYDDQNDKWYGNEFGPVVEEKYRIDSDDINRYNMNYLQRVISK